jgi:hypothetical protein
VLNITPRRTSAQLEKSVDSWLEKSFNFRLQTSFLGRATKFHENFTYKLNSIDAPEVERLVVLHDLVDSEKQGYSMNETIYLECLNRICGPSDINPQKKYRTLFRHIQRIRRVGCRQLMILFEALTKVDLLQSGSNPISTTLATIFASK